MTARARWAPTGWPTPWRRSRNTGRRFAWAPRGVIVFGRVGVGEGLGERFKEERGEDAKVIGTGGYAELIARETDAIDAVDMDLALKGLRLIFEMNRG